MLSKNTLSTTAQTGVHLGGFLPLAYLVGSVLQNNLGGDPVEHIIHYLGIGALRLLFLTLAIYPLVRFGKMNWLTRLRRPLGLWAAAWGTLHVIAWLWLDLGLEWALISSELLDRTYILVGLIGWLILLILTVTSLPQAMRLLRRHWKPIHRWLYPASVLLCTHFWWSQKSGWIEPAIYASILVLLLLSRKTLKPLWLPNSLISGR